MKPVVELYQRKKAVLAVLVTCSLFVLSACESLSNQNTQRVGIIYPLEGPIYVSYFHRDLFGSQETCFPLGLETRTNTLNGIKQGIIKANMQPVYVGEKIDSTHFFEKDKSSLTAQSKQALAKLSKQYQLDWIIITEASLTKPDSCEGVKLQTGIMKSMPFTAHHTAWVIDLKTMQALGKIPGYNPFIKTVKPTVKGQLTTTEKQEIEVSAGVFAEKLTAEYLTKFNRLKRTFK